MCSFNPAPGLWHEKAIYTSAIDAIVQGEEFCTHFSISCNAVALLIWSLIIGRTMEMRSGLQALKHWRQPNLFQRHVVWAVSDQDQIPFNIALFGILFSFRRCTIYDQKYISLLAINRSISLHNFQWASCFVRRWCFGTSESRRWSLLRVHTFD